MAAPVRIESEAFTDPRFDILGQLLGSDRYGALGVMAHIWSWATERGQYEIPIAIASVFVGMDLARVAHIVTSGLASPGEPGHIRIRGSEGRLEWLGDLRSMRVAGGKARAAGAARGPDGRLVSTSTSSKLVQQGSTAGTSRKPAPSSVLTLDPALVLDPDPDHSDPTVQGSQEITSSQENTNMSTASRSTRPRKSKSKASDPTPEELVSRTTVLQKLTARNGVAYEGSKEHTRLIVARMRERCAQGRTAREAEMELRFVIGYCATELGWATVEADKMGRYLRPETLFGPETFYRYLEPARTWSATLENGKLPKRAAPAQRAEPDPDAEPEPDQDWNVVPMFAEET